jgi:hypothetical protein
VQLKNVLINRNLCFPVLEEGSDEAEGVASDVKQVAEFVY